MSQPAAADGRAGWPAGLGMPGPDPEVTVRRAGARPVYPLLGVSGRALGIERPEPALPCARVCS